MNSYEYLENNSIENKKHIKIDKINKIALNPFESKRYWIDNINSLPYGYTE